MSDTTTRRGRRTIARHGRLRARNPFASILRVVGIALACVLVAGLGTAAYATWDLSRTFGADAQALEGQESEAPDIGSLVATKGVDLLLTGIDVCEWDSHEKFGDRCPKNESAYGEDGRQLDAGLNDVNLLVHISPEPRKVTVTAFPRDLMIPTPECTNQKTGTVSSATERDQLNNAYAKGELACVAKTIDTLTTPYDADLAIDYAATVTWNGVIEITNAIGGVDVCVAETIDDVEAGMLHLEGGQTHTLVGEQALAFLRSRHGVGDGGDLGRISNQQIYMSSLVRKLTSEGVLTNPGTLLSLARTALSNVDPSASLANPVTLVQIAMAAKEVPLENFVFLQYPAVTDPYDENRVAPNYDEAAKLFQMIAANDEIAPTGTYLQETEAPVVPSDEPVDPNATAGPTDTAAPVETPEVVGRNATDESCASGR